MTLENRRRHQALTVVDSVIRAATELLPRLEVTDPIGSAKVPRHLRR
ncbi:hypothetical protein ACWCV5_10530 [Streptomyces tubercidicus]